MREELPDPELRAEWERSALTRAVGLWLVHYRGIHDLTIEQFAARAGMTPEEVLDLDAADIDPDLDTLLRLSRSLNTPLELRLDRSEPNPIETVVIGVSVPKAA